MPTVEILDEQMLKAGVSASQVELDGSSTSVRELLRARIEAGIKETGGRNYSFFVPSEAEAMLNADFDLEARTDALLKEALDAFTHRRFVVLWNGEQILDPEARLVVQPGVKATFLRLVPLVGG